MELKRINVGSDFLKPEYIKNYNINNAVIDKNGLLYIFDRNSIDTNNTHDKIAKYLRLKYYLRIAYFIKHNDGIICPDTVSNINFPIKDFIINEQMCIALYNMINSKNDNNLSTFEEKLAKYASDFGYYTVLFNRVPQIYDYKMFNNNMDVLSYTLGKRFDKKFFIDILSK